MMTQTLDPITFAVLRHKLDAIVDEAYYTIGQVSGNPVVFECGDHQEAITTPAGELAVFGGGVLHWTRSLGAGVQHVVSNYAENPGFEEDDQFLLNNPYIAPIHHSDVQLLAPVFYEGEIIAWAGSASHQTDVGGIDPGSVCVSAGNLFEEGFLSPGIKFVERGRIRKDLEDFLRGSIRSPEIGLLDIHAKIAANNIMKQRLVEMAGRYGKDVVAALFEQLISYSEARFTAKLHEIPDGRWTSVNYVEGRREPRLRIQITAIKENDRLTFDFTGTSPQASGSENMAVTGAMSSVGGPLIAMLCHDIPWNEGLFKRLDFILPEGTIVNPRRPAAVSAGVPCGANILTMTAALSVLSKMLYSSDAYRDEACGNVTGGTISNNLSGIGRDGRYFSTFDMDHLAGGTGGYASHDGTNAAQNTWAVKTMISNVETIEMLHPLIFLWRKMTPDSGGPGKFRGGVGLENALMAWGTEELNAVTIGVGTEPRPCLGFAGGYPAANTGVGIIRNVGLKYGDATRLPAALDEISSEWEPIYPKGVSVLGPDDVMYAHASSGGGGFGDPLDRDPAAVLSDVGNGYVSVEAAQESYGVIFDSSGEVDVERTLGRRRGIVEERLQKAGLR